jgi:MFS family permease
MRQLDLPSAVSFFTISAVVLLIFRPIAGRFVDRDRATAVIVTGLLLFSAVCVIISRTPLPSYSLLGIPCWLILAAFFYGIAFGSLLGSLQATALMRTTPECYGTATATFFLGFDCGNGLGPVLFGSVCGILGYRATYAYFALPLLVAAFLPFFLYRPRSK